MHTWIVSRTPPPQCTHTSPHSHTYTHLRSDRAFRCGHVEGSFGAAGNNFCQNPDKNPMRWCPEPLCAAGTFSRTGRGVGLVFISTYLGYCDRCPPGKYSLRGATLCSFCEAGKYWLSQSSSACHDCPVGKFSTAPGQRNVSACSDCVAGKYSSLLGSSAASQCLDCPLHSFPASATGASECLCETGFAPKASGGVCTGCEAGKFKSFVGPGSCKLCVSGTYSNFQGAATCSVCPRNASTGAAGATMCECNAGFTGSGSNACTACGAGTYKSNAGSQACVDPLAQAYAPASTDVIVKMILGLPINPQDFSPDVQVKLRVAIARAAQVPVFKINIDSFHPADLRRAPLHTQALLPDPEHPALHSHVVPPPPPPPPHTHVKVHVDVAAQNSTAALIVMQNLSPAALTSSLASEQVEILKIQLLIISAIWIDDSV